MPKPTVFEAMETYRAALLRRERQAAARLVNSYGEMYKVLQTDIGALAAEIGGAADPAAVSVTKLATWKRLRRNIVSEMDRYGSLLDDSLTETARQSMQAGQLEAKALAEAALPGIGPIDAKIMATWQELPTAAIENLLGFLADDSPLRLSMREQMGEALAGQVEKQLVTGLGLGRNPRAIAKIIRDELGQGLTWSLRTARTANLYAYREASRASYAANNHVVKGWIWRAKLDEVTCLSCVVQDGTVHKLDERLNDHHNGRCWMEPQVKSYKELGLDIAEPQRPERQTGADWFGGLDAATQQTMMGQARFEAWQNGEFDLTDLSQTRTDPVWGEMRVEASLRALR